MNKKLKNAFSFTFVILAAIFAVMRSIAKKHNENDKYKNDPKEQNPMYGKKVVFVENSDDPVNADGLRGHLEAVGESRYTPTFYDRYIKRGADVILSFCGMVVLAPVYAIAALAIKIDDPGPFLFRQKRIAQGKGYFELMKMRSMSVSTPSDVPTHMLGSNASSGITRVGGFLRKTSCDELPQLYNIFKGDMSIIGPRPALWNQDHLTAERDKYGANDVRPGLTGLAQISGRDELEIPEKARLDGVYADALKKSSLSGMMMDIKIFVMSVKAVLHSDGVVEGGTGRLNEDKEEKVYC